MSQHSLAVAAEAVKNPELLGSTNQHDKEDQVKEIKEQEKERKEQAKFNKENRNSVGEIVKNAPSGVYAQEYTANGREDK